MTTPGVLRRLVRKAQDLITRLPPTSGVMSPFGARGWWPVAREPFAGAWQRGLSASADDALTHSTYFACITLIANDIAKCAPLLREHDDGIAVTVTNPAYSPVLRRPNHYQNRIQFYQYWALSKLTRGAAFALKERDGRGVVNALYLLDPSGVKPMVAPDGSVFYALPQDVLAGVDSTRVVVPAREIIHDTMYTPYHPLIGVSPTIACGLAVMQSLKITSKATRFFQNDSMLGGLLVAPGQISADTAARLEKYWTENYGGEENIGKIAAVGDGLKFEKPKYMSAVDAQLIEQLRLNAEQICGAFHVPRHMVGVGPDPNYNNIDALNTQYYAQCLQVLFESLELCLTEGLECDPLSIEFDLDDLLRMDSATKMKTNTEGVRGGIKTPNEARRAFNLPPIKGGDTVYMQEQDHSLQWLADRDAQGPPPLVLPPVAPPPKPDDEPDAEPDDAAAATDDAPPPPAEKALEFGTLLHETIKALAA